MSTFQSGSLFGAFIAGIFLLAIALIVVLGKKSSKSTKLVGLGVLVIAVVLMTVSGIGLYVKSSGSQDKSQVYMDVLGDNPGMQITTLDTGSQTITYVVHGQEWPVCVARYSLNDQNHFVVDAESVMCQKNVPQKVRDAQKNAASTTTTSDPSGNSVLPQPSTPPPAA